MRNMLIGLTSALVIWLLLNYFKPEYTKINDKGCTVITSRDELGHWTSIERCPEQPVLSEPIKTKPSSTDYIITPIASV